MKNILSVICLTGLCLVGASAPGVEVTAPAKPVPAHSNFIQPSTPREGRDPFYPESARPFESTAPVKRGPEITFYLKSPGFSETSGTRLVIINNHTFSVGDEGDVLTAAGRVHLHCVEIRNDLTVVEINGQRREIHYSSK